MYGILFLVCLWGFVQSIPIDNSVIGDPEIECGSASIAVNFNTRNPFQGVTFVKGRYSDESCKSEGSTFLQLDFSSCGVRRERQISPRGIFVTVTVVISFHPRFITKVDRAVTLQCFYMEADKTVSQELEVSMLTTAFQTQVVPMPVCRYEVLDGGVTGSPVKFALIGQQVYHKWTCDSETTETFCMRVHSCFVDDGQGESVLLLDELGCAMDKYLLRNLEYLNDLMAGQEAHVFKFADRANLFFQCQVEISIRETNVACPRPDCPLTVRGRRRKARAAPAHLGDTVNTTLVDVMATPISVFDINADIEDAARFLNIQNEIPSRCFSFTYVYLMISICASLAILIGAIVMRRRCFHST